MMPRHKFRTFALILLALFSSAAPSFAATDPDLVGLWHMDGDWTDASGNGRNGTASSSAAFSTDARVGSKAGSFNGSDGYVDMGSWFTPQTFSFEMWVKAGSSQVQYANIIDSNHNSVAGWEIEQNSTNTNQYYWGIPDGSPIINFTLPANQWTHIAITRDGSTRVNTVYINGTPLRSTTGTQDITYNANPFVRLAGWYGGGRNWNGLMDDVALYNRVLSANEILHTYNAGIGGTPPDAPTVQTVPTTTYTDVVTLSGTKPAGTSVWVNGVEIVSAGDSISWTGTYTLLPGSNTLKVWTQDSSGRLSDPVTVAVNVVPANQLDPSLVGLWHMDGNWYDYSGNANNGTPYNGVTFSTNAKVGTYSGSFDGASGYVSIVDSPTLHSDRVIAVTGWIYVNSLNYDWQAIYWKGNTPDCPNPSTNCENREYALFLQSTGLLHLASTPADRVGVGQLACNAPSGTIQAGQWYHFATVISSDDNVMKIYVNGVEKASCSYSAAGIRDTTGPIYIGDSVAGKVFNGLIDEVVMYNRLLTGDEINRSYNSRLGRVALWHMDGDWTDASGNGNNGMAYNGATFSTDARVGSQAGSFDGVSAYVNGTAYSLPLGNAPRAISAWVKMGNGTQSRAILQYGTGSTSNFQIFIDSSNKAAIGTDSGSISGTSTLSDSQWHYVVGIYDGTSTNTARIYVDGVLENSGTITAPNTSGDSFSIGAFLGGGGYFNGLIDEVVIYNRAITADEINKSYNDGLGRVGLWHVDGDWADSSGNNHHGTPYSVTFNDDRRTGTLSGSFDGTKSHVSVPDTPMLQAMQFISIASWIKPGRILPSGDWTSSRQSIVSFKEGDNPNVGAVLALPEDAPDKVRLWVKVNNVWYNATGATVITPNQWYYVTGTYDGYSIKVYVNGELDGQTGVTGIMMNAAGNASTTITIGSRASNNINWFQGLIDEVSLYNRALTADEINKQYNDGQGRVGLWHMDGDWTDASGNGNNGTANGATFSTDARIGGQAGSFDGVSASVNGTTYSFPSGNSPRTISAWVKLGGGTQNRAIFQYGAGLVSNFQLFIDSSSKAVIGSSNGSVTGTSSLSDGQWHYVVGSYEGPGTNIARIYVDGILENSGTISPPDTESGAFSIGVFLGGGGYLNGLVDEAAIYNRILTADEISKSYNDDLGRIGLWHLDGDWTDASGNGNNGTAYNGATFSTNARVGVQSGSFNGVNAYATVGNIHPGNSFTVEAWVYDTSAGSGEGMIVGRSNSYFLWIASGNLRGEFFNGTSWVGQVVYSGFSQKYGNTWTHVAITKDQTGGTFKLYINGNLIMTDADSNTVNNSGATTGIGAAPGWSRYFNGLIDDAAIYNRALMDTEIINHYAAAVPYIQIISPAPGPTNNNTPLLNYTILNGAATAIKVDGNIVSKVSGDSLDILSDGAHSVRVEAVNSAGTIGFAETSFTVDTVPPTLSINPVTSPTNTTTQTITGSMETGAAVTVSVNTTAVAGSVTYPTTTTWSCTVTNLAWGSNVITATASDAAGNTSTATATILQYNISISNVAVSSNVLDVSAPNTVSVFFTIDKPATMTLKIIPEKQGPTGTLIYQSSQSCLAAGAYMFTWDGKDSTGKVVPDDAYLFILEAAVDGTLAGVYSPAASGTSGTPSFSSSGDIDPFRNIPKTITYSVSTASRCTLWFAVPYTLWETPSAWGYKILDNVPLTPGNYTLDWDGRNRDGKVVARPGMLVPGTSVPMDIFPACTPTPLVENHIITSGDAPRITNVKTDPSETQLSYGQFTRIKYHLSRDANVTITLISPSGAETTLVNSQAQSAGDREFEWNALDPADASGKKTVLSAEGSYTIRITAANPVTGSSSKAYANLQMGF